jgi:hypothetical protein
MYLILPAAPGPGDYSASNRNVHQKLEERFLGSRERPVLEADKLTPSVSRLSRQCRSLYVSQPARHSLPVAGVDLLLY